MNEGSKREFVFSGVKKAFLYSLIAAGVLTVAAIIYSLVKTSNMATNIYLSYYYFGAFALIFAIPQFYKRNEEPRLRKVRTVNPFKFNNPYEEKAKLESFKEFKGEGFWVGMFIVLFSIFLFLYAVILESIIRGI